MPGEINLRTDLVTTMAELDKLSGLLAVAAELNLLDGAIYTADELNAAVHSAALLAAAPDAAGIEIQVGSKSYISLYNETGSATVIGEVVIIAHSNDYGAEAIAVVTTNFPVRTAVSLAVAADHVLGWYQLSGEAEALVDGDSDDVDAGEFLEVVNGDIDFTWDDDGSARTTVSAAVAVDANTSTQALKTVILIPEQHTIA